MAKSVSRTMEYCVAEKKSHACICSFHNHVAIFLRVIMHTGHQWLTVIGSDNMLSVVWTDSGYVLYPHKTVMS